MSRRPRVIVSGGQTGVDRGALDAALEAAVDCGGWCPAGRRAEDGPIPDRYPLREIEGGDYPERTRRNVADSDGTLVIMFPGAGIGTRLTAETASTLGKPLLIVDANRSNPGEVAGSVRAFVERHHIRVLNVAGPRESEQPGARAFARQLLAGVLARPGTKSGASGRKSPGGAGRKERG